MIASARSIGHLAAASLLIAALVATAGAQTVDPLPRNRAEFASADPALKARTLNALATLRYSVPTAELGGFLKIGLADPSPEVRAKALAAVGGHASASRFSGDPARMALWESEKPTILQVRGDVLKSLGDPDESVRKAAVLAITNMDWDMSSAGVNSISLRPDALKAMSDRFPIEPSPAVRAEIAKTYALTPVAELSASGLLALALGDTDPTVVHYGIMGLMRLRSVQYLDLVARLLKHQDKRVRSQAAVALGQAGGTAKMYLADLETAAAAETDPIVMQTMSAAIGRIRSSR